MGVESQSWFYQLAKGAAKAVGQPAASVLAVLIIAVWLLTGPLFGFSDTWQLVINTGTSVITFLMVFLIQNSQNRDTAALHVKLDELIRATHGASNALMAMEDSTDDELEALKEQYSELARAAGTAAHTHENEPTMRPVAGEGEPAPRAT